MRTATWPTVVVTVTGYPGLRASSMVRMPFSVMMAPARTEKTRGLPSAVRMLNWAFPA
jgi:hypothetical protein